MKTLQKVQIIADSAESSSGVLDFLEAFHGMDLQVKPLPQGDYWLGGDLAVERKEVGDFVSSIVADDKRLFNQARGLKELGLKTIFIVEGGSLYDVFSGINESAIIGALSYLVVVEGVTVLRSEGAEDTASLLFTMARHAQHGLGYEVPLRTKPARASFHTQQQFVVEGLPGVGPTLAQRLLAHFGSVRLIMAASVEELAEVRGISTRKAAEMADLLDALYEGQEG